MDKLMHFQTTSAKVTWQCFLMQNVSSALTDSGNMVSSNIQLKYVTGECCLISLYITLKLGIFLITFGSKRNWFRFAFPKKNSAFVINKLLTYACKILI